MSKELKRYDIEAIREDRHSYTESEECKDGEWVWYEDLPQWISLEDEKPEEYKTVLTFHKDDLCPVAAFLMDGDVWLRDTEGP